MEAERNRNASNDHHQECAREPIHVIGHIQSHGLLFALHESDLSVRHVSANISELLGVSPEAVLGRSFEQVIGAEQFVAVRASVNGSDAFLPIRVRLPIKTGARELPCLIHRQGDMIIMEFELAPESQAGAPHDIDTHVRIPLLRLESAKDLETLSQVAADEIGKLSGFDRVMIYRFDDLWNGEVLAEVSRSSPVSYLGSRFPATDIPPQARQLFLVNTLRTIVDVDSERVPIVPDTDHVTGKGLDLTQSLLRSASLVHMEYLRNMEVKSSMTVSIIVKGRLWGLIACHHPRAHAVDRSTRSIAVLLAQNVASQIALRIDNATLQKRVESRDRLEQWVVGSEGAKDSVTMRLHTDQLLELFDADGLISRIEGMVSRNGVTVGYDLLPVISKLRSMASRGVASSHALGALDRTAAFDASHASGALYVDLGEGSGDFLLFLRQELVETVLWAGNPHEAVIKDVQNRLHPRASFASWSESIRGLSRRWTVIELENALYLREQLLRLRDARQLEIANQALMREMAERKKAEADLLMAQKLESIGQLAAGIAHEINTPTQFIGNNVGFLKDSIQDVFTLIALISKIAEASNDGVIDAAKLVGPLKTVDLSYLFDEVPKAIEQSLEGIERIQKIVGAMKEFSHPATEKAPVDLNRAINTTIIIASNEWKYVAEIKTDFDEDLPQVSVMPGSFNQVILNMIVNAAHAVAAVERTSPDKGTITLSTRMVDGWAEIRIHDTGCGIPDTIRDRIFDPFFTTKPVGKGTGQGLSIAHDVIVNKHGGTITVESTPPLGTTFILRLPLANEVAVKHPDSDGRR